MWRHNFKKAMTGSPPWTSVDTSFDGKHHPKKKTNLIQKKRPIYMYVARRPAHVYASNVHNENSD